MADREPIAVIGYSYRAPGVGGKNLSTFLEEGRSAWSKVPSSRFDQDAYHHPDKDRQGGFASEGGCFLPDDLYSFDAAFFNLRAEEARLMDPQHRLILECAFEAAEHAGLTVNGLAGSNIGVFAANDITEYGNQSMDDSATISKYTATAGAACMFANRVSYFFDLEGPSIAIDVACAGGSSALHLAAQSIRAGECSTAFVAASNLMICHNMWIAFDTMGALSDSGRCYSYDAKASGFGRGEGAACLLVKRLSDAVRDGDPIHAVVANTACSHGGKTDAITVPSQSAQQKLLQRVHDEIGWDPADTPVVEGHGTGTKVGDPIEASAITTILAPKRTASNPVYLGSIKSNIGHTESVSGLFAIIKAILQLQQDKIFPTCGFDSMNSAIESADKLRVVTSVTPWPSTEKKRICVSNFGFGGGNAATLLEEYHVEVLASEHSTGKQLVPISAKSENSLRAYLRSFREYLQGLNEPLSFRDLCYTLGTRRSHFTYRAAIPASSVDDLSTRLEAAVEGKLLKAKSLKLSFVFTGQGAQHAQMASGLDRFPVYLDALAEAEGYLVRFGAPWNLREELQKPAEQSRINEPGLSQPLCTAIQIALVKLLASVNVTPAVVTGHSSGEIAACYAAGFISFETAMAVAYFRGKAAELVASDSKVRGGMLALGVGAQEASGLLPTQGYATIAAINSPRSVTVSGDVDVVDNVERQAQGLGIFARRLKVNVAYHSRHLQSVAASYLQDIEPFYTKFKPPITGVDFFSSVTGQQESMESIDASYWIRNLTQPVRFLDAVDAMLRISPPTAIVEVGPHSALKGPIIQILESAQTKPAYFPTLVRGTPGDDALLAAASNLFEAGADVSFASINNLGDGASVLTTLPPYEWNKSERYIHESRISKLKKHPGSPYHHLLGWRSPYTEGNDISFRQVFTLDDMPWLRDHNIAGEVIFPMTGYTSLAIEGLRGASRAAVTGFVIREFHAKRSLKIDEDEKVEITTKLTPLLTGTDAVSSSAWSFQILSWAEARGWIEHCSGQIDVADSSIPLKSPAINSAQDLISNGLSGLEEGDAELEYREMAKIGLRYGPGFQCMTKFWHAPGVTVHEVALRETEDGLYDIGANVQLQDSLLHTTIFLESMSRARSTLIPTYFRMARGFFSIALPSPPKVTVVTRVVSADEKLGSLVLGIAVFAYSSNGDLIPVCEMEENIVRAISTADGAARADEERAESYNWTLTPYVAPDNLSSSPQPLHVVICGAFADHEEHKFAQDVQAQIIQPHTAELMQLLQVKPDQHTFYVFIDNPRQSILTDVSGEVFNSIQNLMLKSAGVLWVVPEASGPAAFIMKGFLRSLRLEDASRPFLHLEGVPCDLTGAADIVTIAGHFTLEDLQLNEQEFVFSSGGILVPRLVSDPKAEGMFDSKPKPVVKSMQSVSDEDETNALQMTVDSVGSLDAIYFRRLNFLADELGDNEVIIKVEAAGVNFRDLLLVLGSMPWHSPGLEGVGVVVRVGSKVSTMQPGDRVCYASMQAGFANYVRIPAIFVHTYPTHLVTPIQMATMPVAYSTAYWSLVRVAQVQAGETVLIHAASGAVGQACITIAKYLGARIFVTAGTDVKRRFLETTFDIPREQIFSSRTAEFRNELLCATNGKGVDVIINSLSGPLLEQTWSCIAEFGRFIEIGKKDLLANSYIGLRPFERNVSFHALDLRQLFLKRPEIVPKLFSDVLNLLQIGAIEPINAVTEVPIEGAAAALRKLQTGQNIGKVVITVSKDDKVFGDPSQALEPAKLLRPDATYLITGGTGGIGRTLAMWMFEQGAKNVVLLGRSGASTPEVAELISQYSGSDFRLRAIACDVGSRTSLENALAEMQDLPPVGGVIHGALYLRDAFLMNSTWEDWQLVTAPKISAAWYLDELLPKLDFFVCLASIAGVTGNAGQTIYAGTTTFLDAFASHRRSLGRPTISINLPVINDAGYAKNNNLNDLLRLTLGAWLDTPQVHILVRNAILACRDSTIQDRTEAAFSFIRSQSPTDILPFERFEMYSAMRHTGSSTNTNVQDGKHNAESFLPALMARVCTLTMMDADEVTPDGDLMSYGLDSLVSVELRNWIRRETGVEVALNLILAMSSLNELVEFVFK